MKCKDVGSFYKRKKKKLCCLVLISATITSLRVKGGSTGCHPQSVKLCLGLTRIHFSLFTLSKLFLWYDDSWAKRWKAGATQQSNPSSGVTSSSHYSTGTQVRRTLEGTCVRTPDALMAAREVDAAAASSLSPSLPRATQWVAIPRLPLLLRCWGASLQTLGQTRVFWCPPSTNWCLLPEWIISEGTVVCGANSLWDESSKKKKK